LGELHYQGATPLEEDEGLTMPNYDPKDNFFLQLVHVALMIVLNIMRLFYLELYIIAMGFVIIV
jgi:hypothetical protein